MSEYMTHMSHCNLGDYEGSCKYGEEDCPAMAEYNAKKPRSIHPKIELFSKEVLLAAFSEFNSFQRNPKDGFKGENLTAVSRELWGGGESIGECNRTERRLCRCMRGTCDPSVFLRIDGIDMKKPWKFQGFFSIRVI